MFILRNQIGRLKGKALVRWLMLICAGTTFVVYLAWNIVWISCGTVPPSLLVYFTGLPCPTTGCLRALNAYSSGELLEGFLWNPVLPFFIGLLAISFAIILTRAISGKKIVLPNYLGTLWLVTLACGWILKFIIGRNYW